MSAPTLGKRTYQSFVLQQHQHLAADVQKEVFGQQGVTNKMLGRFAISYKLHGRTRKARCIETKSVVERRRVSAWQAFRRQEWSSTAKVGEAGWRQEQARLSATWKAMTMEQWSAFVGIAGAETAHRTQLLDSDFADLVASRGQCFKELARTFEAAARETNVGGFSRSPRVAQRSGSVFKFLRLGFATSCGRHAEERRTRHVFVRSKSS